MASMYLPSLRLSTLVHAGGVRPRAPAWEMPKVHLARVRRNTEMFLKSSFVFRTEHLRVGGGENQCCKHKVSHH